MFNPGKMLRIVQFKTQNIHASTCKLLQSAHHEQIREEDDRVEHRKGFSFFVDIKTDKGGRC